MAGLCPSLHDAAATATGGQPRAAFRRLRAAGFAVPVQSPDGLDADAAEGIGLPEVQKRLGIKRFSLGSFSESCRVFEPAMLQEVVDQLAGELRADRSARACSGSCPASSRWSTRPSSRRCARWPRRCFCRWAMAATVTPGGCTYSLTWTITCPGPGRSPRPRTPARATRRAYCAAISRRATPT